MGRRFTNDVVDRRGLTGKPGHLSSKNPSDNYTSHSPRRQESGLRGRPIVYQGSIRVRDTSL